MEDNGTLFGPEDDNRGTDRELQIFDNGEFHLEIIPVGDSFIVSASGLARSLGMRDAHRVVESLPDDEKGYTTACTPGDQGVWHVTEPGLYRAIGQRQAARIKNPDVQDQVVRFQRWVYHDVLPSIRKTGQYGQVQFSKAQLSRKELARQWYEAEERAELESARADGEHAARMIEAAGRQAAEEENAILLPKAAQADHHRAADGLMTFGDFANKLNAFTLQNYGVRVYHKEVWDFAGEMGLIIRGNTVRKNRPTSFATEKDYVRESESEHEDSKGKVHANHTSRLTPRGDGWLWDRAVLRIEQFNTLKPVKAGAA